MTIIKKLCLSEEEKVLLRRTAYLLYEIEEEEGDERDFRDQCGISTTFSELVYILNAIANNTETE